MRVVAQKIDAIAIFRGVSRPVPYKFRYTTNEGSSMEIKVDRVISIDELKIAGVRSIIYECQSAVEGTERRYQLKYLVPECRWELYKI